MDDPVTTFERIRNQRGLNKGDTARELGAHPSQLSRILDRRQIPGRDLCLRIRDWSAGLIPIEAWAEAAARRRAAKAKDAAPTDDVA